MTQNYEPGLQLVDDVYQTLFYNLRDAKAGEHSHAFDFSCIDNDLLSELQSVTKIMGKTAI